MHGFGIARGDDDEIGPMVLHHLQQFGQRFSAEVAVAPRFQRVCLVDEEHPAQSALHDSAGLGRGLPHELRDQVRPGDLHQMTRRQHTQCGVQLGGEPGHGCLAGAGRPHEQHVARWLHRGFPRCAARRPERRGGREQVHGRLHLVLPGKRVDLGQDLADRGAPAGDHGEQRGRFGGSHRLGVHMHRPRGVRDRCGGDQPFQDVLGDAGVAHVPDGADRCQHLPDQRFGVRLDGDGTFGREPVEHLGDLIVGELVSRHQGKPPQQVRSSEDDLLQPLCRHRGDDHPRRDRLERLLEPFQAVQSARGVEGLVEAAQEHRGGVAFGDDRFDIGRSRLAGVPLLHPDVQQAAGAARFRQMTRSTTGADPFRARDEQSHQPVPGEARVRGGNGR